MCVRSHPKVRSAVLATCLALTGMADAQQPTWHVRAGATYTQLSDPLGTGNGQLTGRSVEGMGYHLGVAVEPWGTHTFRLRTEALFDLRVSGYWFDPGMDVVAPERPNEAQGVRRVRTQHLELPVLLSIHHWEGLRLEAGPACALLLHGEERCFGKRTLASSEEFDLRTDVTAQLAILEWAAVVGLEVFSGKRLSMGLRYWGGLTDLDRAPGTSPSLSRTWQFSMAYAFRRAQRATGRAAHPALHRSRS
jgi:hypothetical protein